MPENHEGTEFSLVLWRGPERAARSEWVARCVSLLEAIRSNSDIQRFVIYDDARVAHDVGVEPDRIEAVIAREADETTEMGSRVTLIGTDGSDPTDGCHWRLGLTVGLSSSIPGVGGNNVVLALWPGTDPRVASRVFRAAVEAWSPSWGCIESLPNLENRDPPTDAGVPLPLDHMLHWVTYFGPERAGELDLEALDDLPTVAIRELGKGIEVVLGGQWPGEQALLAFQRETEPRVFQDGRLGTRLRRRLGL